ncbi:MAG TPA: glycosyl hydrolase family 28-related protein [Anaerolineae bacterium]|nr:glycosyl hydrolase family 28-related protein [Anaerolineae bacterium]HQI87450.1 glycosyl hydrolase family 28-related protein [Anaerolineae bacterium]
MCSELNDLLYDLPAYGVNVRDYGARGDDSTDDASAIQAALDARRGLVTIPYGIYRIGRTLRVPAHTHLRVHPHARLVLADGVGVDQHTFLLTNQRPERGDVDIRIEGGIWDGNNVHNPRGPDAPTSYTGVLLNFANVRGLTLRALTLRDPESYYIRMCQVQDFTVEDIRLEAPHLRPNQDGVHLGGYCEDGVIRNIHGIGPGVPNDDLVALSADDATHRAQNLGKLCGPLRRIRIEDLHATDCHTFVRLLSVHSPVEDIDIRNLHGGCHVAALNLDACRECRVPLFDPDDPQVADGVGMIARVRARGIHVHKVTPANRKPLVDLRTRVRDFVVEDFTRDATRDACPEAASLLVAAIGTGTVLLNGITAEQVTALQKASTVQQAVEQLTASVNAITWRRGTYMLERSSHLVLPADGWERLTVNMDEPSF